MHHRIAKLSNSTRSNPLQNQKGASMIEYALLVALVALIAIPAVGGLGKQVELQFVHATDEVAGSVHYQCVAGSPIYPACPND